MRSSGLGGTESFVPRRFPAAAAGCCLGGSLPAMAGSLGHAPWAPGPRASKSSFTSLFPKTRGHPGFYSATGVSESDTIWACPLLMTGSAHESGWQQRLGPGRGGSALGPTAQGVSFKSPESRRSWGLCQCGSAGLPCEAPAAKGGWHLGARPRAGKGKRAKPNPELGPGSENFPVGSLSLRLALRLPLPDNCQVFLKASPLPWRNRGMKPHRHSPAQRTEHFSASNLRRPHGSPRRGALL